MYWQKYGGAAGPAAFLTFLMPAVLAAGVQAAPRLDTQPAVNPISKGKSHQQKPIRLALNGFSEERVERDLKKRGLTDVTAKRKNKKIIEGRGCKGSNRMFYRYHIKRGIIRKKRIGTCVQPKVAAPPPYRYKKKIPTSGLVAGEVAELLRSQGYHDVRMVDPNLPGYIANACHHKKKLRLHLNRFGIIKKKKLIGKCRPYEARPPVYAEKLDYAIPRGKYPKILYDRLASRGYNKIRFVKRTPTYIVEACRDGDLHRIKADKWARIKDNKPVGYCQGVVVKPGKPIGRPDRPYVQPERPYVRPDRPYVRPDRPYVRPVPPPVEQVALRPKQVRRLLRGRGYNRIRFVDRELPVYIAEACKYGSRYRLRMNRYGDIKKRRGIGYCGQEYADTKYRVGDIRDMLQAKHYFDIKFVRSRPPFYVAEACRKNRRYHLRINEWGEIQRRKNIGWCNILRRPQYAKIKPYVIPDYEFRSREKLRPHDCQDFFDALLYEKTILFDVGSAAIEPESYQLLDRVAFFAKRCPRTKIEVAGHTDSDGPDYYNQSLSEARAQSVTDYLIDQGVRSQSLFPVGYGEQHPVLPNDSEQNKSYNRRIEFIIDEF